MAKTTKTPRPTNVINPCCLNTTVKNFLLNPTNSSPDFFLLLEDGFKILLEDGSGILLE
jgi:hypothetical protein